MFTLKMRRNRYTWITAGRGSLAECRQLQMHWLELGYLGETKIEVSR
jgi:hypothetical protein